MPRVRTTWRTTRRIARAQGGFSLLEVTIALGISGMLMASLWQLTSVSTQQREVAGISSQATAVTAAAQNYTYSKRSTLLAMPALAALNSVVRIKMISTDTGDTADSVQSAGFIAPGFTNTNSYGQSYALFVRREDAGSAGVADAGDRLAILLITTGGSEISDAVGAKIAGSIGAAGGFMYAEGNPAPPASAVTARGSAGGWTVDLTAAGWSSIGSVASAGRMAMLVNLLPSAGGTGITGGVTTIDGLSDGKASHTLFNVFLGKDAGLGTVSMNNTGMGINVMQNYAEPSAIATNNTAFGYNTFQGFAPSVVGVDNTAFGFRVLEINRNGNRNTAVGSQASLQNIVGSNRTTVGVNAGLSCNGAELTFIGHSAGSGSSGCADASNSVVVGAGSGSYQMGPQNTLIGAGIGVWAPHTGSYNSAIGYQSLYFISGAGTYNTTAGYRAGYSLSSGSNNIMIGYGADAAATPTANNRLNIGNQIYGDMAAGQVSFGSATLVSGISFDTGAITDSVRLAVGTTAQRPTCDSAHVAAQRWNTTDNVYEVCNGTLWLRPKVDTSVTTPVTPPLLDGYLVMTAGTWDGDLGGLGGANAKCYNDLVANDWMGKATATSNGQLTTTNVKAFLCQQGNGACNNATPLSRYWFARAGAPATGGASLVTNDSGFGPSDSANWSGSSYFGVAGGYWSNRTSSATTAWGNGDAAWSWAGGDNCDSWRSNLSSKFAIFGDTNQTNQYRWAAYGYGNGRTCDQLLRLVCFVHP